MIGANKLEMVEDFWISDTIYFIVSGLEVRNPKGYDIFIELVAGKHLVRASIAGTIYTNFISMNLHLVSPYSLCTLITALYSLPSSEHKRKGACQGSHDMTPRKWKEQHKQPWTQKRKSSAIISLIPTIVREDKSHLSFFTAKSVFKGLRLLG